MNPICNSGSMQKEPLHVASGCLEPTAPSSPALSPELLALIARHLSASRALRTLSEFSVASKGMQKLALPEIHRTLDLSFAYFSGSRLEAFLDRMSETMKWNFVKELILPPSKSPERRKALLSALSSCSNVVRVSLDLDNAAEAAGYWKSLHKHRKLSRLDLEVSLGALPYFRSGKVKLPSSVRTLRLFLGSEARAAAAPIYGMLERADHLEAVYTLFVDPSARGLGRFPRFAAKLRSACVYLKDLAELVPLDGLKLHKLIVFNAEAADSGFWDLVAPLRLNRLTVFGFPTARFSDPEFKLDLQYFTLLDPVPCLEPAAFDRTAEAVRASGIRIRIETGSTSDAVWRAGRNLRERELWMQMGLVSWAKG